MPNDQPATECIICGRHINAGTYPPFCSKECQEEYQFEVEYLKAMKSYENNGKRKK
jgi:predicted nucleic acid-binding Zn ribbon protein